MISIKGNIRVSWRSGCGKSTTGKAIIKLNDITSGEILYEGQDIQKISKRKDLLKFNKKIQMIFQDPYASLNPRLKVMDIVAEGIDIHKLASSKKTVNVVFMTYLKRSV